MEGGLRPFAGEHAGAQPPDIPDVLLHETAVSWLRERLPPSLGPHSGSAGLRRVKQKYRWVPGSDLGHDAGANPDKGIGRMEGGWEPLRRPRAPLPEGRVRVV